MFTINLRRHLRDDRPVVTNLSAIVALYMPRRAAADFDRAVGEVSRRIGEHKRQLAGLPFIFASAPVMCLLPHAWFRRVAHRYGRFTAWLLSRGLVVTNIGPLDAYLATFGERAVGASVIGPFIRNIRIPLITATGFRDRVTLQINAYDHLAEGELEEMATSLERILRLE